MRWEGHVAYVAEIINAYEILIGKSDWRPFERLNYRWGKIMLKGMLKKYDVEIWTALYWLRIWRNCGHF
jgi:hypothetical protein